MPNGAAASRRGAVFSDRSGSRPDREATRSLARTARLHWRTRGRPPARIRLPERMASKKSVAESAASGRTFPSTTHQWTQLEPGRRARTRPPEIRLPVAHRRPGGWARRRPARDARAARLVGQKNNPPPPDPAAVVAPDPIGTHLSRVSKPPPHSLERRFSNSALGHLAASKGGTTGLSRCLCVVGAGPSVGQCVGCVYGHPRSAGAQSSVGHRAERYVPRSRRSTFKRNSAPRNTLTRCAIDN